MDTLDDALRSSDGEVPPPRIPRPDDLELSDEEIRRLQKILNSLGGKQYSFTEAKYRGLELLRFFLVLMDPKGYEQRLKHPLPVWKTPLSPPQPDPVPDPRPFPIPLEADHPKEIEQSLRMLADELRHVRQRPSHWRWALVALYEALGHTLAEHRPANFLPYTGLGQLTRLFDAVAALHPDLPQVRRAVEEIERLRTTFITWGVTRWPVSLGKLPGMFADGLRVIRRLEPGRKTPIRTVEKLMGPRPREVDGRGGP